MLTWKCFSLGPGTFRGQTVVISAANPVRDSIPSESGATCDLRVAEHLDIKPHLSSMAELTLGVGDDGEPALRS